MQSPQRRPRGRPRRNDPTGIAPAEPPPCHRDDALVAFQNEDYAFRLVVALRWPMGIRCPHCLGLDPGYLMTRQIWKCRLPECRRQFSVRVDTLFEDSPIALGQWLSTLWLYANEPQGISSYALREVFGVTQKTGWLMLRRIRLASERASLRCLPGDDDRARFISLTRAVLAVPHAEIRGDDYRIGGASAPNRAGRKRSGLHPEQMRENIVLTYT